MTKTTTKDGWVCPRCKKVNSPYKGTCDCVQKEESEKFHKEMKQDKITK